MPGRIDSDVDRFNKKKRQLLKEGFKHRLNRGVIKVPSRGGVTRVPIDRIETPRFVFDQGKKGGVGQGDGDVGDPLPGESQQGGGGDAGHGIDGGKPAYEDIYTREQFAELLEEMLELPTLKEPTDGPITEVHHRYNSIRRVGPRSLRHMRRSYREALKRSITSGTYDKNDPMIILTPEDFRYRSSSDVIEKRNLGVFLYLLDASGSTYDILDEAKQMVDLTDLWLERRYDGIVRRYVHYSHEVYEVVQEDFFRISATGGTDMASGLEFIVDIAKEYAEQGFDIYLQHITDGDYESEPLDGLEGEKRILRALKDHLIPWCSGIYVAEIPTYSTEKYSDFLFNRFGPGGWADGKLRVAPFDSIDGIADAMQIFFQPLG